MRLRIVLVPLLILLPSTASFLLAEQIRAVDIVSPTNVDWIALARAEKDLRTGHVVEFVLPPNPLASYAEIRRMIWLAGLHGITNLTCSDERTIRVLEGEFALLRKRQKDSPAVDIAIRDIPAAAPLYELLVNAQATCSLIGEGEKTDAKTILRRQGDEVLNEVSGVTFTSMSMAATLSHASHTENGLVFENDGNIATNVFVRRSKNGTATVVNLANATRRNLLYRRAMGRISFDLLPADVVHIAFSEPQRLTQPCGELYPTGLWKVDFDDPRFRSRLIHADRLPTIVNETYMGPVRYRTTVGVPGGVAALYLHLDVDGSETEVSIGGIPLGTRAWEPFEWPVPPECRGKNVPLEIHVEKRTFTGFLQTAPIWHTR